MNKKGDIIPAALIMSLLMAGIGLVMQQLTSLEVRSYLSITDKIEGFYGAEILAWHDRRRATETPTALACPVAVVNGKCPLSLLIGMGDAPGVNSPPLTATAYNHSTYSNAPLNILTTNPIAKSPNIFRRLVNSGHITVPNTDPSWCGSFQILNNSPTRHACLVHPPPFFLIADRNNNRVLLWKNRPSQLPSNPIVLGQINATSGAANGGGGVGASTLFNPRTPCWDGNHLVVSDSDNNRILIWNKLPKSNATPADLVLGQPNFTNTANSPTDIRHLNQPNRLYCDANRIIVVDRLNHRVLIWNSFPTSNFTPADAIVGQTSATGNNWGLAATRLKNPFGVATDGNHLAVADYGNNRILIWNTIPTGIGASADVVFGQTDFTSGNSLPVSQQTLNNPIDVFFVNGKFIVVDDSNNRVLIWNSVPTAPTDLPNLVLGQNNFTSSAANQGLAAPTAQTMDSPLGVYSSGNDLWVSDSGNNRVLIWDTFPTTNGQAASRVLGQPDFTGSSANQGSGSPTSLSLSTPVNISSNINMPD